MYHFKDNVYFDRLEDGSVRIIQRHPTLTTPMIDINVDPDSWASIVASVSKGGETGDRVQAARELHESA